MRRLSILIAVLALTGAAPTAWAAVPGPVADCNAHGQLTQGYSVGQLRAGLNTMPADVKEYTDCYDVLQRQLLAQLGRRPEKPGGRSAGGGSGSSFLPAPVIVVLVVLILGAGGFGALALRRRRTAGRAGGP